MKIPLLEWARKHYSPPPSLYVLRQWARNGEIVPPPERVGKAWHVREDAQRLPNGRAPMPMPAQPCIQQPMQKRDISMNDPMLYVFGPQEARKGCREFYDPRGVECGVYLVMHKERDECLYVGSSIQLNNRLRNGWHAPPDQPTFSFEVPEIMVRNVEATYWDALSPRVNAKSPPGIVYREAADKIRSLWKS
jgi:hypothetical protein